MTQTISSDLDLKPALQALLTGEHFFWVGFYLVQKEELVLGPFQGPIACTRIAHGRGVCGTSWSENKTINVPDVDTFPGHIACSSESKSELVIPVRDKNEVVAVLDIDSAKPDDFSPALQAEMEEAVRILQDHLYT